MSDLDAVRWHALFPPATRASAFLAGFSLPLFVGMLDVGHAHGLIPSLASSRLLFFFALAYYFGTIVVFVIDVRLLSPKVLKTRIPFVYFPTNREGLRLILARWGRMLCWGLGVTFGSALLILLTGA